jgi:hypothetical protein
MQERWQEKKVFQYRIRERVERGEVREGREGRRGKEGREMQCTKHTFDFFACVKTFCYCQALNGILRFLTASYQLKHLNSHPKILLACY